MGPDYVAGRQMSLFFCLTRMPAKQCNGAAEWDWCGRQVDAHRAPATPGGIDARKILNTPESVT